MTNYFLVRLQFDESGSEDEMDGLTQRKKTRPINRSAVLPSAPAMPPPNAALQCASASAATSQPTMPILSPESSINILSSSTAEAGASLEKVFQQPEVAGTPKSAMETHCSFSPLYRFSLESNPISCTGERNKCC